MGIVSSKKHEPSKTDKLLSELKSDIQDLGKKKQKVSVDPDLFRGQLAELTSQISKVHDLLEEKEAQLTKAIDIISAFDRSRGRMNKR